MAFTLQALDGKNNQISRVWAQMIWFQFVRSFQDTARVDEFDDQEPSEAESVLKNIDSKTVASILRGLAEAADNWDHNEL